MPGNPFLKLSRIWPLTLKNKKKAISEHGHATPFLIYAACRKARSYYWDIIFLICLRFFENKIFLEEECIMKTKAVIVALCLFITVPILFGGCANMTPAQEGAVGGAAVGAIAGQIIGGSTKATLIGAGVGALGGALVNDELKKDKKDKK
jgi:osmotically inducible lipoprotein OsmB